MPRRAGSKPRPAVRARRAAAPLTLAATCTLREATELQRSLLQAAADPQGLCLDGGAVRRIDSAGLQLLAGLALREAAAGRLLRWQAASDELKLAAHRAGLTAVLALDAKAAA